MGKVVYHYCSVETFLKIIKNKELWLTDVTKSNDSEEIRLAYNQLIYELDMRIEKCKQNGSDKQPFEKCKKLLLGYFDINNILFHVCCFSADRDSLSQWAMYADNATGVAIGFDSDYFINLQNNRSRIKFAKVDYSLVAFIDIINEKVKQMLDEYDIVKDKSDSWLETFLNFIINDFMEIFCFYKNSCFMQENEYRLVYNSKPYSYYRDKKIIIDTLDSFTRSIELNFENNREVTIKDMDYYTSNGKMISYRPLHMNELRQVIKEIVIGPKSSIKERDVEIFLSINHIHIPKDKIVRSDTTYQ